MTIYPQNMIILGFWYSNPTFPTWNHSSSLILKSPFFLTNFVPDNHILFIFVTVAPDLFSSSSSCFMGLVWREMDVNPLIFTLRKWKCWCVLSSHRTFVTTLTHSMIRWATAQDYTSTKQHHVLWQLPDSTCCNSDWRCSRLNIQSGWDNNKTGTANESRYGGCCKMQTWPIVEQQKLSFCFFTTYYCTNDLEGFFLLCIYVWMFEWKTSACEIHTCWTAQLHKSKVVYCEQGIHEITTLYH